MFFKNWFKAIVETLLDKALEINPESHEAWNEKGTVFIRFKMFEEALKCFDKTLKIYSEFAMAWNNKSVAPLKLYKFEELLNVLMKK